MSNINLDLKTKLKPALYIIATPIGNKSDITLRAIETLKSVNIIYCEDTRTSKKLLNHYDINTPLASCHEHNEESICNKISEQILNNQSIGLISDAGTPLINDPGFKLVRYLHTKNIPIISIPGPSALTAALSIAGVPTDEFTYYGFFPIKKSNQDNIIDILKTNNHTNIFYESPHRILKTLKILENYLNNHNITICKELTKIHENTISGTPRKLLNHFDKHPSQLKGEFVILIYNIKSNKKLDKKLGNKSNLENKNITLSIDKILKTLKEFLPPKECAKIASKFTGVNTKDLYDYILKTK